MPTRIGIDIGGTFTDLIFVDDSRGRMRVAKVPTTPDHPERGCLDALTRGLSVDELAEARYFMHGTTVGLNALLERRGATLGLLCTKGHRDILELGRGDRAEMYNLTWRRPQPLVPRRLRIPLTERIGADGRVLNPLVEEEVTAAAEVFKAAGVTAVAIALLNAYANPEHETMARVTLRAAGFTGEISLSHEVSGEYREYERTCTTVVDAFVRGRMANYFERLQKGLEEYAFSGDSFVTRAGGGSMSFAEARLRPFETIMSGPVAGVMGAAKLAEEMGEPNLVTADVGGTSFDASVLTNGRPTLLYQGEIIGLPLQTAWVDVRSIGAGGGSLAQVDSGGLLRVGPESAGSIPGPACYARGGDQPTVSDAAFYLGMLGSAELSAGLRLDRDLAEAALRRVSQPLGCDEAEAARSILTIAAASTANLIRELTVEQGLDPREMALVAFGGAGPMLAVLQAVELEIKKVIVPPHAGNFSAWGLLRSDLVRTLSRTRLAPVAAESMMALDQEIDSMFEVLATRSTASDSGLSEEHELALDVRYRGQEHCLTLFVEGKDGRRLPEPEALQSAFEQEYMKTYGLKLDAPAEIVTLRATLRRKLPDFGPAALDLTESPGSDEGESEPIEAWSFARSRMLNFAQVRRTDLANGETLIGPAIILELTTRTYLDAGWQARVHETGSLILTETNV